ncbi:mechanosensitive ion channel family protein [Defluviitalea raffinosedens]|uniref:Mechanosensitive ion channel n=1 Tax=Defluviitalea raffinosedens TaxID=1450156 RepID=A0A7C8HH83_9FIRM|nr:mechanosensitive ion channel domain-containing protein [Defluviitalea raffinosedens]KAE9635498.1 mechanosensitive ion channel [Defluviitalea raffinosedens]MBM7684408.1 small conductance mechanosensitive channel [Defluviitalea raffinosedens]HHW68485.1 mechanosensitive ion channel [Candidatus Epulonipiscium sp.]
MTWIDLLTDKALEFGPRLLGSIVLLVGGLWLIKFLVKIIDRSLGKSKTDESLHSFIISLSRFGLKLILYVTVAATLGVKESSLITALGAAGLAIGLALQGSLANFAGGVLILAFRPFNVGDYIEAQGFSGTVKEIQILYTILLTPDNKKIVIPNGELSNHSVINYSAQDTRRLDLVFGVGYDSDILKAKEILNTIAKKHPLILKDPAWVIGVSELGERSVNFDVKLWCKTENYWTLYYDFREKVKLEFDKEKITIPYPQMDIHIHQ